MQETSDSLDLTTTVNTARDDPANTGHLLSHIDQAGNQSVTASELLH